MLVPAPRDRSRFATACRRAIRRRRSGAFPDRGNARNPVGVAVPTVSMAQQTERTATKTGPRSADGRRFEVFIREAEPEPLRHVGTVAAPTPDVAHERAGELFGRGPRDVWLCPAEETHRYSDDPLTERHTPTEAAAEGSR